MGLVGAIFGALILGMIIGMLIGVWYGKTKGMEEAEAKWKPKDKWDVTKGEKHE